MAIDRQGIRKLIVFSTQDSSELSSWSNVPYLFCETLKSQGIRLEQVTIRENASLRLLVLVLKKALRVLTGFETSWDYSRSWLHFLLARWQMDRACWKHEHDGVLVLTFSYGPSRSGKKPLFLFGDWPYAYAIEYFKGRTPDWLERHALRREREVIETADDVFILFPVAQDYVASHFAGGHSHYLGNVINAVEAPKEEDIAAKAGSRSLVFIGKPHYREGADRLLEAFARLKPRYPDLTLDIIGMDESSLGRLPEGVQCHGYLDKGDDAQRSTYYRILRKARIFVNTNPKWASFSATLEAMYFHTPIITSKYPEMQRTFGEELSFGTYFLDGGRDLEQLIEDLLRDEAYIVKARWAHEASRNFSWGHYVTAMMKIANARVAVRTSSHLSNSL